MWNEQKCTVGEFSRHRKRDTHQSKRPALTYSTFFAVVVVVFFFFLVVAAVLCVVSYICYNSSHSFPWGATRPHANKLCQPRCCYYSCFFFFLTPCPTFSSLVAEPSCCCLCCHRSLTHNEGNVKQEVHPMAPHWCGEKKTASSSVLTFCMCVCVCVNAPFTRQARLPNDTTPWHAYHTSPSHPSTSRSTSSRPRFKEPCAALCGFLDHRLYRLK
jgi:hypothetical protein